jgi:hypothetical protein
MIDSADRALRAHEPVLDPHRPVVPSRSEVQRTMDNAIGCHAPQGVPDLAYTAGKTVAMYFGQPVVNLGEFLPDEAIPDQDGGRRGASSSGVQVPLFNAKQELEL